MHLLDLPKHFHAAVREFEAGFHAHHPVGLFVLRVSCADPRCRAGRRGRISQPNPAIFLSVVTISASFYHF